MSARASSARPCRTDVRLALVGGLARPAAPELRQADRVGAERLPGRPPVGVAVGVRLAERRADLRRRSAGVPARDVLTDAVVVGGAGEREVAGIAARLGRSVARDRERQADVAEPAARRAGPDPAGAETAARPLVGRLRRRAREDAAGARVARAIRVRVASRAAIGVRGGALVPILLADELPLVAVELRAVGIVVAGDAAEAERQRRVIVADAPADHAIDVGLALEAEQAGQADVRAAWTRQLAEAEMVGRAAILRVAVRDADVGRVRRRRDQLGQAGLPGAAIGTVGDATLLQAVEVIGVEIRVLGVKLRQERRRAGRADRVRTVAVLGARLHRHADALVDGHVGAQAAEVSAAARSVGRGGVVWIARGELGAALHADRVLGGERHRLAARLRAEVGAVELAGGKAGHRLAIGVVSAVGVAGGGVAGEDAGLERGIVDRAADRQRQREEAREGARGHLIMLLTKGASDAFGARSRYCL